MSAVTWELSLGGDRRPLRAWGLRGALYTRRSFAPDELELQAPGLAIESTPLFADGSTVVLWRDGVRQFTGRVTSPEVYGTRQQEGHSYLASGPWWALDRITYQESRFLAVDPTDPASPLQAVFSPRAVLFNTLQGGQQSAAQQIVQAVQFAATRGGGLGAGVIDLAVQPPWEEATSISCAEVIKRSARYVPDAAAWLNYGPAIPLLNVRRRDQLAAVSINLAARDRVEELSEIKAVRGVPGVRFFYEDIITRADGSTRARYRTQQAGFPDQIDGINEVIELGGQGGENPEPIPADLAATFLSAVSATQYAGSIRLKGRDVLGTAVPGTVLNLSGGRGEWQTMRASVQSWRGDLLRGVEEISFGPAGFLGAGAFADYLRYARLREKSGYLDARRTGEGVTSAVSPRSILFNGTQFGYTEIELCDSAGGTPRRIKVFSEILEAGGPPPTP